MVYNDGTYTHRGQVFPRKGTPPIEVANEDTPEVVILKKLENTERKLDELPGRQYLTPLETCRAASG